MKFFYLPLALLGAASVAAQGQQGIEQIIKTLPKCATGCGLGSTAKSCREFDIACTCKDPIYLRDLSCCLSKQCNPKDIEISAQFAKKLCGGVGVTDIPAQATCAANAATTGAEVIRPTSTSTSSDSSSSSSSSSGSGDSTSGSVALAQNPLLAVLGAAAAVFV